MNKLLRKAPEEAGFTLLEALVVMALLGLMVSLAAPAMSGLRQRHHLQAEAEGFFNSLVLARSEALRRQQRVSLCARASDSECDDQGRWQQGWLVFVDANDNARRDTQEPVLEIHPAVPGPMRLSGSSTLAGYFSYSAEGRSLSPNGAFMAGTWRFCRASVQEGWQVVSNALGKPRLQKYSPQDCE